ncbi:hypothetical protein L6452_32661 [Arctium lappa]|uniref:Uncharacterized protein n=1 Tax=Arctium lappa TaxID=4217 RepID=A0ACB8Z4Y4_ARCLA|nr:hypothetical protein L6452_32661 [Arctium lappa]
MNKQKANEIGPSGMYTIDLFTSDSDSWVLDTRCGTHICTTFKGLRSEEKMKPGQIELRMGNGAKVAAIAEGTFDMKLPNGLILALSNCLYADGVLKSCDDSYDVCESCLMGKMTKPPFNGKPERATELLVIIHTDVCEPFSSTTRNGHRYFITFTDDFSRYGENKVLVARRDELLENDFLSRTTTGDTVDLEEIQEPQDETMVDTDNQHDVEPQQVVEGNDEIQTIRRSSRSRQEPERYGYLIGSDDTVHDEPVTYQETVSDLESDKWHDAMKAEIQSMSDNQVWNLVDAPTGCKVVGCKWVFKKKTGMDGIVHTYKAMLVAKGFTQTHGIDYDEKFSPVAMIKSIRILLDIVAFHDYEIWQMDVKTVFLNGTLREDVYMQASPSWNLRFDEKIKEFGFLKNEDEPYVYKKVSGSTVVFLILYVDDILIIGNDIPTLKGVKDWLGKCFAIKDLGEAAYILGIKIYRDRSKRLIGLSQSTYIDKILRRFKMEGSKRGNLPMVHGVHLSKTQSPISKEDMNRMKGVPYASAIGSIMYSMLCIRPDVSYALSMTSRYQSNPGDALRVAVKNILKYLRRTKEMFLLYGGQERDLCIQGYIDASFQTDRDDYKSQSGYVFMLNGGAMSWKSYKQSTIVDSTTESEYIAASNAAKEDVWMKKFITDLGVVPSICDPVEIYCDNEGAIAQAKEPRSHQCSKHIMRRYHLIREIIERGDIKICKVRSEDNPADPFTKPLSQSKHDAHISSIGLRCNQSHMRLSEHKALDKTHGQDHLIDRHQKVSLEIVQHYLSSDLRYALGSNAQGVLYFDIV